MSGTYIAYYEDAAKVEAAAIERGYTGKGGESWHDFADAEHSKFRTSKEYSNLSSAVKWLKGEIKASKGVYGVGTIILEQEASKRCVNCTCGGVWAVREYSVDESGIVENNTLEPPCEEI